MPRGLAFCALVALSLGGPSQAAAQVPTGREAIGAITTEPLQFSPPQPERHELSGVPVLLLEDGTLPLVTIMARFRGGYGVFGREWFAVATGLPAMLRYGGTESLEPDSVEQLLEFYAMQTSFESSGVSLGTSLNTLTEHLDESLDVWWDLVAHPGFDQEQIDVWRGREVERVIRRADDPGSLAYSAFNRLMYGDHSIGWEMTEDDLAPERVAPERFREMHRRIFCRDNLVLGVAGDLSWSAAEPRLQRIVEALPPCTEDIPSATAPDIRREPGVFVIDRDLDQSVIIMAEPTSVHLADDPSFFAATIGNAILGGGGFSSRILQRVRSDEGYAYSASSLWTMPRSYDGLLGAVTRTRPENVVAAIDVILEAMDELRDAAPSEGEVRTAVDRIVNGYVFNFQSADQIVSRMMLYEYGELPEDWLERYVEGVQDVTPQDVRRVFADNLRPTQMTILVVGALDRIGMEALEGLGPVTLLDGG